MSSKSRDSRGLGSPADTVGEWLAWGRKRLRHLGRTEAVSSAEYALGYVTGFERYRLYLDRHKKLAPEQGRLFRKIIQKRSQRVPLAYLLKTQPFWKEELKVGPGCLIPRPETEILIERFIANPDFKKDGSFTFLDLCAGSGAVGIAVLREFPKAFGFFADVSKRALGFLKANVRRYGLEKRCRIVKSDLFGSLKRGQFDAILCNPPYVADRDWKKLEPELFFEPDIALKGGPDGLDFYRKIIEGAPDYLKNTKWLMFEAGKGQAARITRLLAVRGFQDISVTKDHAGIARVIAARFKG